jgi:pyruvate/2-oxoglutarate dehydrogenase complex dihydrolipoamide dehydrogenase (E3) component
LTYDIIVVGCGAAGEAAATSAGDLGARVVAVERDLFGGECKYWACMPSKTLLDSARRHAANSAYPWDRASARRDWMISREGLDYPSDAGGIKYLEHHGAEWARGTATIVGPGKVEVRPKGEAPRTLEGRNVVLAAGSVPVVPPIEGIHEVGYWTSRDGTSLRHLPSSIIVLGGGPVGVELAQVYARFGVKTTIVQSDDRILARDHPKNSAVVATQLLEDGVEIRTKVRGVAARAGGAGRILELSDGTAVEGTELMIAIGRRPASLRDLGAEEAGVELDERGAGKPDEKFRVGEAVFVAGDVAGGLQFTHIADYEGRVAARAALGQAVRADLLSVPRTTFTEPETGAVGMTVKEANDRGIDAEEFSSDFSTSARGYTIEGPELRRGARGHVTIVVDRERKVLIGSFAACPGASELIHEAVLAIKLAVPLQVLADTIHAFPTGARVFGNLVADVTRRLG